MSFPVYEEYKDSGVDWLGVVPSHWESSPLGSLFRERRKKVNDSDYPPLSVTKNGIVPQLATAAKTDDNENRRLVCAGDFVINSRSDRKGSSGKANEDGSVSLINTVITPNQKMYIDFVHHLLRSTTFQEEYYRSGKGIVADLWSTNYSAMKRICLSVPSLEEQRAIASFLDAETAKIDGLVAEQRRLIALLKEKRQAVISHAVTKGLNPHAPMKDSGIQWLGDVPEHWKVGKLSYVTSRIGDGLHGTPKYVDESKYRFVNGNNLSNGFISITASTRCVSEEEYFEHRVELNNCSLLMSINGTIGNLALYNGESVMLGKSAAFINCVNSKLDREFLYWFLRSGFMRYYFEYNVTGTTIYNLSLESIRKIPVLLPHLEEQRSIAKYLYNQIDEFDSLISDAERAIDLLQERRTALISAAVTGKIDVRKFANKQTA